MFVLDEREFENLFDEFFESLCAFASHYVKDDALVVDIVQDCFMALWQRRKDILHDQNLKSLLYTMVRNACLNDLKKQKYRREDVSILESEMLLEKNED